MAVFVGSVCQSIVGVGLGCIVATDHRTVPVPSGTWSGGVLAWWRVGQSVQWAGGRGPLQALWRSKNRLGFLAGPHRQRAFGCGCPHRPQASVLRPWALLHSGAATRDQERVDPQVTAKSTGPRVGLCRASRSLRVSPVGPSRAGLHGTTSLVLLGCKVFPRGVWWSLCGLGRPGYPGDRPSPTWLWRRGLFYP